ncbi:MAG: aminotransferase class III-fold pyridoxal phosphate-dependent enzyme [Spirochaetia bacterium]|jgi:acetylornithine/succinyldiaminopimelate/putrescine aminotransferase|nr:aminotransferase class III-fold pyridoxal phosphate-dependent enzyme [Spirochaetia bacterium]
MNNEWNGFVPVEESLRTMLGHEYIERVLTAASYFEPWRMAELNAAADEVVDFHPEAMQKRADELLQSVGSVVCSSLAEAMSGAPTDAFRKAQNIKASPLVGYSFLRIGEDGKLYLISKSEHYHASLGHSFPGYKLIENARKLGIANITHNNTRGHIQRLLERELVRIVNSIPAGPDAAKQVDHAIASNKPHVLNRVINLETGSIACEAALKMMLARFYSHNAGGKEPEFAEKIPVILVMADNNDGLQANYHGTNILNQMLRGMWPSMYAKLEAAGAMVVKAVKINDIVHFKQTVENWNSGKYKIAGFFHEIILMNYGAIKLGKEYLQEAYRVCDSNDIPVCCDEIQSCIWYPGLFLFSEYGLKPDFVTLGKGFPGGQYPASKVITTAAMDNLSQFGALVTNGQEELAAIAYLVTMRYALANEEPTREVGDYFEAALRKAAKAHPALINKVEGFRLLSSLYFYDPEKAIAFVRTLNKECIDISAHTYKANCEPSALLKLPLTATPALADFLVGRVDAALAKIEAGDDL